MQRVFVLDADKQPLMPCTAKRARELLSAQRAAVWKRYPFTIILKDRVGGETQPIALKYDPGSKTTGMALVATYRRRSQVVWAAELSHRGSLIAKSLQSRSALRRGRRNRHTRYRAPRWANRTRIDGWLAPSTRSRVSNIVVWTNRVMCAAPIEDIAFELVRFDMQLMQNPEIEGVEYQQGELAGYEVREYLLDKWGRTCAYCGAENVPLEIEHLIPRSRGGSDRVSNLTIACHKCNQKKGNKTAEEFGFPELMKYAKIPLKDAAAINTIRWAIWRYLNQYECNLETGSGGLTKYNRVKQNYPKAHWIDAACVGKSGRNVALSVNHIPLRIKAQGRGSRQRAQVNKYGFPVSHRPRTLTREGFRTGDMITGRNKTKGKLQGRGVVSGGGLDVYVHGKRIGSVRFKNAKLLQAKDGYSYDDRKQS